MARGLTVTRDETKKVEAALRELSNTKVLLGVAEQSDADARSDKGTPGETKRKGSSSSDDMNNATLAYIHENGSPLANIPARPFLEPGIKDSKDKWSEYMRQAGEAALDGNISVMRRAFNAAGLTALMAVKAKITAGIPPPLKPATIAARKRRVKSRKATSAAQVTPLVDTAQMLNSLSYVVKKKGQK
jgi:hypothetical protein